MNINLVSTEPDDLKLEFGYNKQMIERVTGKDSIASVAPFLVPEPGAEGMLVYQVWWPTVWHTFVWVDSEGILHTQDHLGVVRG